MCEPTTIAYMMMAVSIAGTAVGAVSASDAANKQEKAIQEGITRDQEATAEQYKQINKAAMDDQSQLYTQYLIDDARIAAMQGESGMQGATHERTKLEAENNSATDMATLERNRVNQSTQARTQSIAQRSKANLQLAGIQRPSSLGTALKIGGAVAGAYKPDKPAGYDSSFDNPKDYG